MRKLSVTFLVILSVLGVQVNTISISSPVSQQLESRIVNGDRTNDAPFNVFIDYLNAQGQGFFGGGSLISDRHILTAANLIVGFIQWNVGLGSTSHSQMQRFTTTQALAHPNYVAAPRNHDIGIITLHVAVTFSASVWPIQIPPLGETNLPYDNEQGAILGFGFSSNNNLRNDFLQLAYQRVISNVRCITFYPQIHFPQFFCAEDGQARGNICNGDLGGAFTTTYRRQEILTGISSLILRSCDAFEPSAYVRVSHYRQWIRDNSGV